MLQFTYKLKLTERVKAKCSRHPRYNPEKDGRAGIRGGCSTCFSLYDLHQARLALDAAQREFVRQRWPLGTETRSAPEETYNCNGGASLTNLNLETICSNTEAKVRRPIWFRTSERCAASLSSVKVLEMVEKALICVHQ